MDYLGIAVTCLVAWLGILWKQPGDGVKALLMFAALLTSLFAAAKVSDDNEDKRFAQSALASMLEPTHTVYDGFYRDIDGPAKDRGFDLKHYVCAHNAAGLVCSFTGEDDKSKRGVLVLEKGELAEMIAKKIRKESRSPVIQEAFDKPFTPAKPTEELLGKAAIVGFLAYYDMYCKYPEYYYYDGRYGTKVISDLVEARLTLADFASIDPGKGVDVFQRIQDLYRSQLTSKKGPPANCS